MIFSEKGSIMIYAAVEEQIHSVPEEYLNEIAEFIDYILFKAEKNKTENTAKTSSYFGCLKNPIDGMAFQRNVRDEWN